MSGGRGGIRTHGGRKPCQFSRLVLSTAQPLFRNLSLNEKARILLYFIKYSMTSSLFNEIN
jgi:hypothetical protein